MNQIYSHLFIKLYHEGLTIVNRKGGKISEIRNAIIKINPREPYAFCRNLSLSYLVGELLFYLRGENKLAFISPYSKFWTKVSDDGENINSCYGYYLLRERVNTEGKDNLTQFSYCRNELLRNPTTKKAVMTIYDHKKHSKHTNDNPCTMFLQFFIRNMKLEMDVHMRSNDIWYGLPYDVPFFSYIMIGMYYTLKEKYKGLQLGDYTHFAGSLHVYEKDWEQWRNLKEDAYIPIPELTENTFDEMYTLLRLQTDLYTSKELGSYTSIKDPFVKWAKGVIMTKYFMDEAWKEADKATCLKKKVGCVIVNLDNEIIARGWGGRPDVMGACEVCVRDKEEFFGDDCNSLHSEQRAILSCDARARRQLPGSTIYITHGPCDQCMKFLLQTGIRAVVYDKPYKTHFERYEGLIEVYDANGEKKI